MITRVLFVMLVYQFICKSQMLCDVPMLVGSKFNTVS